MHPATKEKCCSEQSRPKPMPRYSGKFIVRVVAATCLMALLIFTLYKVNNGDSNDVQVGKTVPDFYTIDPQNSKMPIIEKQALLSYAMERLQCRPSPVEFLEFAHRLRLYGNLLDSYETNHPEHVALYKAAREAPIDVTQDLSVIDRQRIPKIIKEHIKDGLIPYPASPFLWELERNLFPWLKRRHDSVLEMKSSYSGQGIIIPTGSGLLKYAIHLIKSIRYFNCTLPIMVTYYGKEDIKSEELRYLDQVMKVNTMDISRVFATSDIDPRGWAIKPFSLLASPYEEAIMMDADVVLLQDPQILLNDKGFKEHGALIFRDRTVFGRKDGKKQWLESNLPKPLSRRVTENRMYLGLSAHEQESCVVVWNKRMRLMGLLASCKMNSKAERDAVTYKEFYGDKESFWIGLEMANQSYTNLQPRPGVIGFSKYDEYKKQDVVSGRILQFDRQGYPLLFNGAIVKNRRKREEANQIMNFTHYAREGEWDWGDSSLDKDVTPINATLGAIINDLAALYVPEINYTRMDSLNVRDQIVKAR